MTVDAEPADTDACPRCRGVTGDALAPGRLWSVEELAELVGVPVSTIYAWRVRRYGPRGLRVGRYVRYRESDIAAWVDNLPSRAS